jgi:hypothetical protein
MSIKFTAAWICKPLSIGMLGNGFDLIQGAM